MSERSCRTEGGASCGRCCIDLAIRVPEIKKPAGVPCPKLEDDGFGGHQCSIYDQQRPNLCEGYLCGWRVGELGDNDRPDKSGVLVTPVEPQEETVNAILKVREAGYALWLVKKTHGTDVPEDRLKSALRRLGKHAVIIEKNNFVGGPNKAVRIFLRWIQRDRRDR